MRGWHALSPRRACVARLFANHAHRKAGLCKCYRPRRGRRYSPLKLPLASICIILKDSGRATLP